MASSDKAQYDNVAVEYKSYDDLPMARLEAQLIRRALGDCTGLRVLDLGGGSGTHARQAVEAGASQVDVVDISEGMMQIGKDIEAKAGRGDKIRWFTADVSKPLREQGADILPPGAYDLVMANWVFDHAHTTEELRGMWENLASAVKPGGLFVGIRVIAPGIWADHTKQGKYGCRYEDIEKIPGGVRCVVFFVTEPVFSFGGTMMEDSYAMVNDIPRQLGFPSFETIPDKDMDAIKEEPEFWKNHLDEPLFAVVTAKKV
ncbi:S-adenosyl-L-methionine-dependent methyltransferase [Thozetella sp. PMI_491]|nr:S-adenosyl-L-methionine-dependent methyltransferase [Thozetella sp. PMI_491]